MRILLIGGTRFVGLAIAREAIARGHDVSVFHRGSTVPANLDGATFLHGDRDADTSALQDTDSRWDATIDVCAYRPHQVDSLAAALSGRGGRHVFISTVSVYDSEIPAGCDETAPLASLEPLNDLDPATCDITGETYGPLKVMCEERVRALHSDALIIRPTYVIGPDDYTMRFPTWVQRVSQGGLVQAPMPGDNAMQYVDARDQAQFVVSLIERGMWGAFHTPAPAITFEQMITTIVNAVGPVGTHVEWVSPDEDTLQPLDFPLWSGPQPTGMMAMNPAAAIAAGLTFRPLEQTVRDTAAWLARRG